MLISGGTGAGKTTLLNVLSSFISDRERIVTIEDAAELQLQQEHVGRLETRPPNVEGKGAIRQRQLVINSLRMRPDRIVVGEVRGEEALDMLQAMNTGHDGSLTTIHANTPRDALSRIETMISMGSINLPERAMRQQIASAIQIVVQQTRMSDGTRKVTSISEITGMEGDVITMQEIFLLREARRHSGRQGHRAFPRDRRAAEGVRAAQGVRRAPAAGHVRRRHGGAVMALLMVVLAFVVGVGAGHRGLHRRHQGPGHDAAARSLDAAAGGVPAPEGAGAAGERPGESRSRPARCRRRPDADRHGQGSALARWIEQTGVKTTLDERAARSACGSAAVAGLVVAMAVRAPWGLPVGAALGFAIPFLVLNVKRGKRMRTFEEHFPKRSTSSRARSRPAMRSRPG